MARFLLLLIRLYFTINPFELTSKESYQVTLSSLLVTPPFVAHSPAARIATFMSLQLIALICFSCYQNLVIITATCTSSPSFPVPPGRSPAHTWLSLGPPALDLNFPESQICFHPFNAEVPPCITRGQNQKPGLQAMSLALTSLQSWPLWEAPGEELGEVWLALLSRPDSRCLETSESDWGFMLKSRSQLIEWQSHPVRMLTGKDSNKQGEGDCVTAVLPKH